MSKVEGHVIAWWEDDKDRWEYTDDLEVLVYLYDEAMKKCDEDKVYLFPIRNIYTIVETRKVIKSLRRLP
jgi:hypothetical protein